MSVRDRDGAAYVPPAVVHVDLDGLTDIYRTRGWPVPAGRDRVFESGLRNTLDLFERNGIRATLFLIASSLDDPAKRELVEEALRRGHEIAAHTLNHRILVQLDSAQKRQEIEAGRLRIEDALGVRVAGFRAPGYQLDRESADLLAACGYEYDASAFPTRHFERLLNVRIAQLLTPGRPFGDDGVVELPLPDHRPWPVPFNPSYSLLFGLGFFRAGLLRVRRTGTPLVLLFHLIDLAAPAPRASLRGVKSRLFTLSLMSEERKRARCQAMLRLVREHYRITSTSNLLHELGLAPQRVVETVN